MEPEIVKAEPSRPRQRNLSRRLRAAQRAVVVLLCACSTTPSPEASLSHAPATGASPTLSTSPSSPIPSRFLPGLDRTVCDVTSAKGDFDLGGPTADRAYAFSFASTSRCRDSRGFVAVAKDRGDVVALSSTSMICRPRCRIVAVPDVDRDGVDEIAVGQRGFATFFSLFTTRHQDRVTVEPIRASTSGRVETFGVGGSTQSMWGLICSRDGSLTVWGAAQTMEGSGPYQVRVTTGRLRGTTFVTSERRGHSLPQGAHSLLPESGGLAFGYGTGICGARLLSAALVTV